jgi:alpha-L-arabinofuranosidase
MRLFRRYGGDTAVKVTSEGSILNVTASRRGQTLYLHVVNTDLQSAANAEITLTGIQPSSASAYQIAPDDLSTAIDTTALNVFDVEECSVPVENGTIVWRFPKASVTALQVQV